MFFRSSARLSLWLAAFACFAGTAAWADEFVTIDFPMSGKKLVAPGLTASPRQVVRPDGVGYTEVWLRPVRKNYRVFLSFIFNEDGKKGLAVFWTGDVSGKQVSISENVGEGVVGLNRRTIALPEEVTAEAGRLFVMGRQDQLLRMRIDWCEPSTVLVAADQERPTFIAGGSVWLDRETTGQAAMTPPDAWFGPVLDAALQDGVADLSENTELVVPLKGTTGAARLRAKFLGLSLGKSVRIWVNGKLSRMQPVLPGLTDPGYVRRGKRTTYAGWREGAVFLEPGALKEGKNSILFESPGKGVYLSGAALEIESPISETGSDSSTDAAADATPAKGDKAPDAASPEPEAPATDEGAKTAPSSP